MSSKKRNQWLEGDLSDESDAHTQGYDSEAAERRKGGQRRSGGPRTRPSKRRKLSSESGDESDEEEAEAGPISDQDETQLDKSPFPASASRTHTQDADEDEDEDHNPSPLRSSPTAKATTAAADTNPPTKPLTTKHLAATNAAARKTGVIYISRIPPFMKPSKVRSLLSPYGAINRIFLTPEDSSSHAARVRGGGNRKRSFVDGWVEFESKRAAKVAAETLNARPVGGKKGGFYRDDVWNMRYLRGFRWHHLTEQIANENAERAARLRSEISRARREDRDFVRNVERAKTIEGIKRKRKAKEESREGGGEGTGVVEATQERGVAGAGRAGFVRHFKQNEVRSGPAEDKGSGDQPETVKRVLSKIF